MDSESYVDIHFGNVILLYSNAHKSEIEAILTSHQTTEASLKADHSNMFGTLTLDLAGEFAIPIVQTHYWSFH